MSGWKRKEKNKDGREGECQNVKLDKKKNKEMKWKLKELTTQ